MLVNTICEHLSRRIQKAELTNDDLDFTGKNFYDEK
jgi:hypothetical protein